MPIRITPNVQLERCRLNLHSIEKITDLAIKSFQDIQFRAQDGSWEIYDEPKDAFLSEISKRKVLTNFTVVASKPLSNTTPNVLKLTFNSAKASVEVEGLPEHVDWLTHFLIDLDRCLLRPTRLNTSFFYNLAILAASSGQNYLPMPRCQIILHDSTPNPMVENIKGNLLANLIWAIMGAIAVLLIPPIINFIQQVLQTKPIP